MIGSSFVMTFLIVFRESLEASLIVGIILTVLYRLKQKRYFPNVFASVGVALIVSVLAGFALMSMTKIAQGNWQKILEGGISFAACGVLTYMIFWMDSQAKKIRPEIETKLETAISRHDLAVIFTLPFLAIFREGAETVLFLSAVATKEAGGVSVSGLLLGLGLAVLITTLVFGGGKKVPMKSLFRLSGIFLLLIAAGLLAYGIHEFHELGIIPEVYAPVWDINHILNEKKGLGAFLKSLLGYNGNPSIVEVTSYAAYLTGVFYLLARRRQGSAVPVEQ